MRRVEIKERILSSLEDDGPMTCRELSEHTGVPVRDITGMIRCMHGEGSVRVAKKDRKTGNIWQIS